MNRAQAIREIHAADLGPITATLCEQLRPSIRLIPGGPAKTTTSHFGGPALLPKGLPWPAVDRREYYAEELRDIEKTIREEGPSFPRILRDSLHKNRAEYARLRDTGPLPLSFLCLFRLADIDSSHLALDLPREGSLCFFYDFHTHPWGFDPANRGSWLVLHVSDADAVLIKPPPESRITLPTALRLEPIWSVPPLHAIAPDQEPDPPSPKSLRSTRPPPPGPRARHRQLVPPHRRLARRDPKRYAPHLPTRQPRHLLRQHHRPLRSQNRKTPPNRRKRMATPPPARHR